jgi:hypothetical protein
MMIPPARRAGFMHYGERQEVGYRSQRGVNG